MDGEHLVLGPQWPDRLAEFAGEPELMAAWKHEAAERQAQAAKVEHLLEYEQRKLAEHENQHVFSRRAVAKKILRDAAKVLEKTEAQVRRILHTAQFLQEKLPRTWERYRDGSIDLPRAQKIANAVEGIAAREDLLPVLDHEVAAKAPGENAASLGDWLTYRVAEVDTAGFQERFERAHAKRCVHFTHGADGISRVDALIPTVVAAQVEQELHAQVKNAPRNAPTNTGAEAETGDIQDRTFSQRMADAFSARLENGSTGAADGTSKAGSDEDAGHGAPVHAKIGVLVPVQTLAGLSDKPAISWDRSWALPADQVRRIAADPDAQHDWYIAGTQPEAGGENQIVTVLPRKVGPASGAQALVDWIETADPESENLLAKTSRARFSRDHQRQAVLLRDGHCQEPGCRAPAWEGHIDHKQSFETGGPTTGQNLQSLCWDHHMIKGHLGGHGPPDPTEPPDWLQETGPHRSGQTPRTT